MPEFWVSWAEENELGGCENHCPWSRGTQIHRACWRGFELPIAIQGPVKRGDGLQLQLFLISVFFRRKYEKHRNAIDF
jgi:hypothetical protein